MNDRDEAVYTTTIPVGSDRFQGTPHLAQVALDLPLATLPAGDYLLTFTATLGKTTATRDAQFSVK